jgi:hypothetical protein
LSSSLIHFNKHTKSGASKGRLQALHANVRTA